MEHNKITRDDERYFYIADFSEKEIKANGIKYRCWCGDYDLGGWAGDSLDDFMQAVLSELTYANGLSAPDDHTYLTWITCDFVKVE